MILFAMLGPILFLSKLLLEWAPNIHLVGVLVTVYTLTWRVRALIPIYVFVVLTGLYGGFNLWWMPYLYIWSILWLLILLLPRRMPVWLAAPIYSVICALHGFAYGTLYAPAQALLFGLDFRGMIAWIVAGFPYDVLHGVGNLCLSVLIVPLVSLFCRLDHRPLPFRMKKTEK